MIDICIHTASVYTSILRMYVHIGTATDWRYVITHISAYICLSFCSAMHAFKWCITLPGWDSRPARSQKQGLSDDTVGEELPWISEYSNACSWTNPPREHMGIHRGICLDSYKHTDSFSLLLIYACSWTDPPGEDRGHRTRDMGHGDGKVC